MLNEKPHQLTADEKKHWDYRHNTIYHFEMGCFDIDGKNDGATILDFGYGTFAQADVVTKAWAVLQNLLIKQCDFEYNLRATAVSGKFCHSAPLFCAVGTDDNSDWEEKDDGGMG